MSETLAKKGGVSVEVRDLVLETRVGAAGEVVSQILLRRFAAKLATEQGLEADAEAVDSAVADWRAERELFSDEAFDGWLAAAGVKDDDLRGWLGQQILADALTDEWVSDEAVRQSFQSRLYDFAVIHVQSIRFPESGAAAEVALQLREGETKWEEAATLAGAMDSAGMLRRDTPEEATAALFSAEPGSVVGPFELEEGEHVIYRVMLHMPPRLDESTEQLIRTELFQQRLLAELNERS